MWEMMCHFRSVTEGICLVVVVRDRFRLKGVHEIMYRKIPPFKPHTHWKLYLTPIRFFKYECAANSQWRVWSEGSIFIRCHGAGRFLKDEKACRMKTRTNVLVWFGPEAVTLPSSVVFPWIGHVCARTRAQWEIGLTRAALSCQAVRIVWFPSSPVGTRRLRHYTRTADEQIDSTQQGVLLVARLTLSIALILDDWSVSTRE